MSPEERVAQHYERRAAKLVEQGRGAAAWFYRRWAEKVRDGKDNPIVRRVRRWRAA